MERPALRKFGGRRRARAKFDTYSQQQLLYEIFAKSMLLTFIFHVFFSLPFRIYHRSGAAACTYYDNFLV